MSIVFKPKKDTYFIVKQIRKPVEYVTHKSPTTNSVVRKYSSIMPDEYILYYCEMSSKDLIKGQPIRPLVRSIPLFENTLPIIFDTILTEFINPHPDIIKDCNIEITIFEGKKFGFDKLQIQTLPSNVKENNTFTPLFTDESSGGFKQLWDSIKRSK